MSLRGEPREISLLWLAAHAVSRCFCPIESSQFEQTEAIPEHSSHKCEQPGEAVVPPALKSDVSEQDIQQHGSPELPADGVFGMAEEVADLEGLLDLLEEDFDSPAAAVEIAEACRGPLEVVGEENHNDPFVIDLNPCLDPAQPLGILLTRLGREQRDLVIAQDVAFGFFQTLAHDPVVQVVLGPGDPEDAPACQVKKVGEVHVGLVEDGDLAVLQPGTQRQGAGIIVMVSFLDDGEGGEETLQVEPQVHLRGRLATAMLRPVHAVGHQGDGGGIYRVDGPFETVGQSPVTARRTKAGSKLL